MSMREGMLLTLRNSFSFMPVWRAASAEDMVLGTLQVVQLAYCPSV